MIEHRPDRPSPYRARVRAPGGKLISKSFKTKTAAKQWIEDQRSEMRRGEWVDPTAGDITLTRWLSEMEARKRVRLADSTLATRQYLIKSYVDPYIGLWPLNRITPEALQRWVVDLQNHIGRQSKRPLSPATIRKTYVIVAEALKLAVARGRLLRDPNIEVELPDIVDAEHRYLEEAQVWELADAIDDRFRPFVLIGAFAGLRPGEIRDVRWADIDWKAARLKVRGTKTRQARRTIKIPPALVDELRAHRQRYPSVGHVVIREDGGPVDLRNFRNRRFRSAVRASVGDPMRLHDLRHTHVGLLIAEGAHAKVIADRLGDTVTTTLSVYGHLLEGVGDDAVDRLGRGGVSPNDPQASAEGG